MSLLVKALHRLLVAFLVITFLGPAFCETVLAQVDTATASEIGSAEEQSDSSTYSPRILIPGTNPYYPTDEPEWFRQAGVFYGGSGLGLEYTTRPPDGRYYGSIFASSMTEPDNSRYTVMSGLTIGYETVLYPVRRRGEVLRTDIDGTQFYLRIGPGFGIAGIARQNGEFEVHPGVHTSTAVGALTKIGGQRGALFFEMSGRLGWFPSLDEMHFIGGPQLSIGFLIFSPQQIPVYQY